MYIDNELMDRYQRIVDFVSDSIGIYDFEPYSIEEAFSPESGKLDRRNYVGIGFGEKLTGGRPQGVPCMTAYVVRKAHESDIDETFVFDRYVYNELGIPPYALGSRYYDHTSPLLTDVIQIGRPQLFNRLSTQYRNSGIPCGVAIGDGSGQGLYGTLGAWLTDGLSDYLLTCWHCIDAGNGKLGVSAVVHPLKGRTIAVLTASVKPDLSASTTVDAAMAEVSDRSRVRDFILGLGELRGTHDKRIQTTFQRVRKSGAKTELTSGGIIQVSANVNLYTDPPHNTKSMVYKRQVFIQPDAASGIFADSGDSGAIVVDDENKAVGVLVGGGSMSLQGGGGSTYVYAATPIHEVLTALRNVSGKAGLKFLTYA